MKKILKRCGGDGQTWLDEDWEQLVISVEQGMVIPIIGTDLLEVQPEGASAPKLLYRYIAESLIRGFEVNADPDAPNLTLSDAVYGCLKQGIVYYDIRQGIKSILDEAAFRPPAALEYLAEITDFNLFVTTTFDSLLEDALLAVRYQNHSNMVQVRSYDPRDPLRNEDLTYNRKKGGPSILFHLMGRLKWDADNVVLSDEDLLEFVCSLHADNRIPKKLFDEFQTKHILLLGCSFSDWLARFFLRAAKRRKLSEQRMVVEFVVDDCTLRDENLVLFFQHFSPHTRFYRMGNAIAFTRELRDRWVKRNPGTATPRPPLPDLAPTEPPAEMPRGAIFISYASDDVEEVRILKAHFDSFGLPVWFDKEQLKGGDQYEQKIQHNIQTCGIFIPVISARTERRLEGFFRREWRLAANRTLDMDKSVRFIMPVVLDDTEMDAARVPDCFLDVHWEKCPGGAVRREFAELLRGEVARNAEISGRELQNAAGP